MRKTSACVFLASLLACGVAMAKICKTVGPDGTVTYTDRPGVDSCASEQQPEPAKTERAAPKKVMPVVAPPPEPAATPGPASVADIEKAVLVILDLEERVLRTYDFCAQAQPSSIRRFGDATDGWRDRNAGATTLMRRTLARKFTGEQQRTMSEGVKKRTERQIASVAQSAKDAQIKWCDQTTTEIENRTLDVKPDLLASLPKD